MLSERRRAVRPAVCVIRPQRGAGRFKAVRLTPSRASGRAVAGRRPPRCGSRRPGQQFAAQHEGRMWSGEIPMWPQKRRGSLRTASPGSGILVAALPSID
ncbi:hypothetical protein TcYC6_0020400 [Trypanosoma cruzi]|nr:hypothetical protein TcYC6_0020400 [Trypanosoma cruzi]